MENLESHETLSGPYSNHSNCILMIVVVPQVSLNFCYYSDGKRSTSSLTISQ